MNENIKYLIEDIQMFNPTDYNEESDIIDRDVLNNILQAPKNKNELIKIIQKRVRENKFGNKKTYIPDLSDIDVSNITDMSELFKNALIRITKPIKLDLSDWDVSNVIDMTDMFSECYSITELNLSGWDTSNVTDMSFMFFECNNITELNLSGWDTSNVINMAGLFYKCWKLSELDISDWDTSKVTDMHAMFSECWKLTELDISHFITSNVVDMKFMFESCTRLTKLDVSNFDTSNVTDFTYMFYECKSLKELDLSSFIFNMQKNLFISNFLGNIQQLKNITLSKSIISYLGIRGFYCSLGFDFNDTSHIEEDPNIKKIKINIK